MTPDRWRPARFALRGQDGRVSRHVRRQRQRDLLNDLGGGIPFCQAMLHMNRGGFGVKLLKVRVKNWAGEELCSTRSASPAVFAGHIFFRISARED